jgi:predicted nuclease of predicted toxin-antitoxin system
MRLLVDANLSPRLAVGLARGGHEASHVTDHGLLTASDETITTFAVEFAASIVSADSDFATMLALSGAPAPSLILLRSADRLSPPEQCDLLLANLLAVEMDLLSGAVVSISTEHLRVRPLPITKARPIA